MQVDHVEKDGKVSARVSNLVQVPKSMKAPTAINELLFFSLEPGEFDEKVFDSLSRWAKEKIAASETYKKLIANLGKTTADIIDFPDNYGGPPLGEGKTPPPDDDIPF